MALLFDGTSSHKLLGSGTPVGAVPCTLAAWVYPAAFTNNAYVVALKNSSIGSRDISMRVTTSGYVQNFARNDASNFSLTTGTTALTLNAWSHIAITCGSNHTQYLNGVQDGTGGVSQANPHTLNSVLVGYSDTSTAYFNGRIAEVAIWDVILNSNELLSLASGVSPLLIRPTSLKGHYPLWFYSSTHQQDQIGSVPLVPTGTSVVDGPRILYPGSVNLVLPNATEWELQPASRSDDLVGSSLVTIGNEVGLTPAGAVASLEGFVSTLEIVGKTWDLGALVGESGVAGNVQGIETTAQLALIKGGENLVREALSSETEVGLTIVGGVESLVGHVIGIGYDPLLETGNVNISGNVVPVDVIISFTLTPAVMTTVGVTLDSSELVVLDSNPVPPVEVPVVQRGQVGRVSGGGGGGGGGRSESNVIRLPRLASWQDRHNYENSGVSGGDKESFEGEEAYKAPSLIRAIEITLPDEPNVIDMAAYRMLLEESLAADAEDEEALMAILEVI